MLSANTPKLALPEPIGPLNPIYSSTATPPATPTTPNVVADTPVTDPSSHDVQPTGIDPVAVQPTGIDPVAVQPTGIDPVTVQPTGIDPVTVQPTGIDPVAVQPTGIDPVTGELAETDLTPVTAWDDMNLPVDLLRGIYACGFEEPSPIQSKAIVPMITHEDIIAQAQSGTGKTATFLIGALAQVDLQRATSQVLILTPTRELAMQITEVARNLSTMMTGIIIKTIVGGSSMDDDVDSMRHAIPHVIVGCPGRITDMIRRRYIRASTFHVVVIDEADEMLSSGFKDQVFTIFQALGAAAQIAIFSATLSSHTYEIMAKILRNPIHIKVKSAMLTLEGISQTYINVSDDAEKYEVLKDLYAVFSVSQCIVYCNNVKRVADLCEAMQKDGFPVSCIHGQMTDIERRTAYTEFKMGETRVLVSSDITARGIDVQQVSVVINFDVPRDVHTYLHRIGRSGRWGRKGMAVNFTTRYDGHKMQEIESYYNCQIKEFVVQAS